MTKKDFDGKKMYVSELGVAMQYDDRTVITSLTGKVLKDYLADKRGTLPQWLPRKVWDSFQNDCYVGAGDMAFVRSMINKPIAGGGPPANAVFSSVSPLYEDTTSAIGGVRFEDDVLVHAVALAKDESSAEKIEKTAEAAILLARNSFEAFEKADKPPIGAGSAAAMTLDFVKPLLAALKIERDGNMVRAQSSIDISAIERFIPAVTTARTATLAAAQNAQSINNLKLLGVAMHNYASARKHFPPAVFYGPDGKTPYSWRVALLPYLEQESLYKQYRFDEPWDGPNNRKLLEKMPSAFRCPTEPADSQNASYFVLVGPDTIFDGKKGTSFRDIRDGTSNTLMLVEAKRDIPWTKPEDVPYDPDKPLPKLGGFFEGKFNVAFADGSVRPLLDTISEKTLRALITKDGREVIDVKEYETPEWPRVPRKP